jgi:hypothetical protein
MKQALELERQRDEDESRRRREMAVTQESSTINVPSVTQTPAAGDVSLEVPNDVLKVSLCVCKSEGVCVCVCMYVCMYDWGGILTLVTRGCVPLTGGPHINNAFRHT